MFPDDKTVEQWFASIRWPHGPVCPHCDSGNVLVSCAYPSMRYRCRPCGKRFSVRTGTVMADPRLGCQTWALAIYLLSTCLKGISSMKLHREMVISQKFAWHLGHRLARAGDRVGGPVEVDQGLRRRQGAQQARPQEAARGTGHGWRTAGRTVLATHCAMLPPPAARGHALGNPPSKAVNTLLGWANYFRLGQVSPAYGAMDAHAGKRLRQWLCRKQKVKYIGWVMTKPELRMTKF